LRQDPDIIMVGEIRDKETAQLAVQAALTGHLVLSTIHTNSAIGVIPRLIDMGVEPYLIAPTLILSMAQRLVRTFSPGGGKPIEMTDSINLMIEKQFEDLPPEFRKNLPVKRVLYEAAPSADYPQGLKGRAAVFEMVKMNRELENIILTKPIESELYKAARKQGMLVMKEDALMKAFRNEIPFEEVNKL